MASKKLLLTALSSSLEDDIDDEMFKCHYKRNSIPCAAVQGYECQTLSNK